MRGRDFSFSMEFNGHRFDGSALMCLSSDRTDQWLIDVPSVLWILERVAVGDADARTVRDLLRQATLWDSGCCGECDRAAPYYEEARSCYDAAARRWKHQQEQLDPAVYPYILNKGKIHRLSCQRPPKPALASFPADLHTFAGFFDGCGEDLDAVSRS